MAQQVCHLAGCERLYGNIQLVKHTDETDPDVPEDENTEEPNEGVVERPEAGAVFEVYLKAAGCYRTEVQFYKSLLALKRSIDRDCIVTSQREALQMLRCVISNLEYRFYKAYNMEFEDKRTVYSECAFRLIPREDEPSVCLMHDWIYLPTA